MNRYILTTALLIALALSIYSTSAQTFEVGTPVTITYTARDSVGNVIANWDSVGAPCAITFKNSTANLDTSLQTWNDDENGYSYAMLYIDGSQLLMISNNEWTLPHTLFVNGSVEITLIHTKAEENVTLEVSCPEITSDDPVDLTFVHGDLANFLIELTYPGASPGYVYRMRKYEFVVTPRDKYLNPYTEQVRTRFNAQFVDELVQLGQPPWNGEVFISGTTNYFEASTVARYAGTDTLQWIRVTSTADSSVFNRSDDYEIRDHAPTEFELVDPYDLKWLILTSPGIATEFSWRPSTDPYRNIPISRFSTEQGYDSLWYSITFTDSLTLTKKQAFQSDDMGHSNRWSTTHGELKDLVSFLFPDTLGGAAIWYVDASDKLYRTRSTAPGVPVGLPGHRIRFEIGGGNPVERIQSAPATLALHQNYPNPVQSSATIEFELDSREYVSLAVYNLLGERVASLVDEALEPGSYRTALSAANLPEGAYYYVLSTPQQTRTRTMVVKR